MNNGRIKPSIQIQKYVVTQAVKKAFALFAPKHQPLHLNTAASLTPPIQYRIICIPECRERHYNTFTELKQACFTA
jgi:hypothetical protein